MVKGVILAGGKGSRIQSIRKGNKALVSVNTKLKLVDLQLLFLAEAGASVVDIIVSPETEEEVSNYVAGYPHVRVVIQSRPDGMLDAIGRAFSHSGDENIFMCCDLVMPYPFPPSILKNIVTQSPAVVVSEVEDVFGYGTYNDEHKTFDDTAWYHSEGVAIMGIYSFPSATFEKIMSMEYDGEITSLIGALNRLSKDLTVLRYNGIWTDAGTPEGLLKAQRIVSGYSNVNSQSSIPYKFRWRRNGYA